MIEADPDPNNGVTTDVPVTEYFYDDANRLIQIVAPEQRTTEYVYDDLDRLIETRLPDPDPTVTGDRPVLRFAYDREDNQTGNIDAEGNLTRVFYDAVYRRSIEIRELPQGVPNGQTTGFDTQFDLTDLAAIRAAQPVTEYVYDQASNLVQMTDPLGRQTRYSFDRLHRPVTTAFADPVSGIAPDPAILEPGNSATPMMTNSYDLVGNVLTEQDGVNDAMAYQYDSWYRVISHVDENQDVVSHQHDLVGNLRFLTDAALNTTEWQYDALDREVIEINPQGLTSSISYDLIGNRLSRTDRNDRVITWQYDDLYRVTSERWYRDSAHLANDPENPVRDIASVYDAASRLTLLSDPDAEYSYGYDALDRTTTETQSIVGLGAGVQFSQTFDRNDNLVGVAAQLGAGDDFRNTMVYDNLLRLTQVQQSAAPTSNHVAFKQVDLSYDVADQRTRMVRSHGPANNPLVGSDTEFRFDQTGRIEEISHLNSAALAVAGYRYSYTADSRIATITSLADGNVASGATGVVAYAYDQRGQLVSETYDFHNYQQGQLLPFGCEREPPVGRGV